MKVLVTGGNGFIGGAVALHMSQIEGFEPRAATRYAETIFSDNIEHVPVSGLGPDSDWQSALSGIDVVIHAAARVHIMSDNVVDPLAEFRLVNVDGTMNLARQAALVGVRRFVFFSSIKVNGETTLPGRPFTANDEPAPLDPYGVSKMEAEQGLKALGEETGMEIVIIRPVLVYGPNVKANFRRMMRWLKRGVPLPFGAINNKRSMVALDNLVDLVVTVTKHPAAANQTFLVSDGDDLSTTELMRRLGLALNKSTVLLPVPAWMLQRALSLIGKGDIAQRLCSSLQVDIDKTRDILGWSPPVDVDDALRRAAQDLL